MNRRRSPRKIGRPPNADGEETRRRILEAALDLFAARGYGSTVVREIAERVGISDSAIYRYFPTKRALFDALLEDAGPSVLSRLDFSLEELVSTPPAEGLPRLTASLTEAWSQPSVRRVTSLLIREELQDLERALQQVHLRISPLFEKWGEVGAIRGDLDPSAAAWSFIAPLATIRLMYLNHQGSDEEREVGRALAAQHAALFAAALSPQEREG